MAFGLAVYASQDGLPRHHARLASGRWSGATGRAFHPQDSDERFQIRFLHLLLLSQALLGTMKSTEVGGTNLGLTGQSLTHLTDLLTTSTTDQSAMTKRLGTESDHTTRASDLRLEGSVASTDAAKEKWPSCFGHIARLAQMHG